MFQIFAHLLCMTKIFTSVVLGTGILHFNTNTNLSWNLLKLIIIFCTAALFQLYNKKLEEGKACTKEKCLRNRTKALQCYVKKRQTRL